MPSKHSITLLSPGVQVISKDRNLFAEDHRNDFVVKAAWGDWYRVGIAGKQVPPGHVLLLAKRESDGAEKKFILPESAYQTGKKEEE